MMFSINSQNIIVINFIIIILPTIDSQNAYRSKLFSYVNTLFPILHPNF